MQVAERVREALRRDPNVTGVAVVGSRATGTANPLSDWDLRIEADDLDVLTAALPSLVGPLEPLAAQWDRLSVRVVYMLVLPGAIKVDLFPGDRSQPLAGPWEPGAGNLAAIDAHFWDWILWLGSKALGGRDDVIDEELEKLAHHLLGPLGADGVPSSIADAVDRYLHLRTAREEATGVPVDRRLGEEVLTRLREEHLVRG
jgi:hypothetical protein